VIFPGWHRPATAGWKQRIGAATFCCESFMKSAIEKSNLFVIVDELSKQGACMNYKPFLESDAHRESAEVLRRRLDETGYLFFRGLLDTEPLLALRREVLQICQKHGWLLPDIDPMQGKGRKDAYSCWNAFMPWRIIQISSIPWKQFSAMPFFRIRAISCGSQHRPAWPLPRHRTRITCSSRVAATFTPFGFR